MSSRNTVTATATGTTDSISLPSSSRWALQVTCGTWGVATIEQSADSGTNWVTVRNYDDSADISLTANRVYIAVGGLSYRLNVSAYTAAITLTAQAVSD